MKVIYYSDYACTNYMGNFIRSLLKLQEKLKQDNIESHFIFPKTKTKCYWTESFDNVYFSNIEKKELRKTINQIGVDKNTVIHVHFVNNIIDLFKIYLSVPKKIKIIFHFHNHLINSSPSKIKKKFIDVIYKHIFKNNYSIAVSKSVQDSLIDFFKTKHSTVIYNGIDFERLDKCNHQDIIKKSLNPKKYFNFLIFGNHPKRKGVDLAILALDEVNKKHPIHLYVAVNSIDKFILDISKMIDYNSI